MKNKLLFLLFLGFAVARAQEAKPKLRMPLKEAVAMALSKSSEANLAGAKVTTRQYELESVKNNRYPDVKVSGQYLKLTQADVKLRSSNEASTDPNAEPQSSPKVNQLALAQASVSMPIFSGFKLKNSIAASENLYHAEQANAEFSKSSIALEVVEYYGDLYKAQRSVELLKESLKSSNERVKEFQDREKNGLIARNDLLRAQLQVSKTQLSLDEAEKNVRLLNYNLVQLLKLPEGTEMEISPDQIDSDLFSKTVKPESEALGGRKDLEAVRFGRKAAESNIKVAKAAYFPSLALTGGYVALDVQNVVNVTNAMNVGVGLSYNLSSIFKNGTEVKAAKSKAAELEQQETILTDRAKSEINKARENYELSLKQDAVYAEAVTQAAENYRIVKDKYDNGLSDTNDLLEADVEDLSAKINQTYAKANVILKYYEWLDASGQLTESLNIAKN
ncbi:MAG: TolC family protein [Flavobacterium sp.]|nr:MAG: TolC family protein [Flavobacterium sp.]